MKDQLTFLILARGGSKRLKNKNIKKFFGKPLLHWTIVQAFRVAKKNKVILSTEDNKIKVLAKKYKNLIVSNRPKYLSKDTTTSIEVIRNIIKKFKLNGIIILLQPTSPLRKDIDIFKAINELSSGAQAVMSQSLLNYNSSQITYNTNTFSPINNKKLKVYYPNGAVFGSTIKWLMKNETFYNKNVRTYEMPVERSIDIDYKYQFNIAEKLFKNERNNQK